MFSNVFKRFQKKLARLMRKSALLIEILTHLRKNLRIWFYPHLPILPKMASLSNQTPRFNTKVSQNRIFQRRYLRLKKHFFSWIIAAEFWYLFYRRERRER